MTNMSDRLAHEWNTVVECERELVAEYLLAINKQVSPESLASVRNLLAMVSSEMEMVRRLLREKLDVSDEGPG